MTPALVPLPLGLSRTHSLITHSLILSSASGALQSDKSEFESRAPHPHPALHTPAFTTYEISPETYLLWTSLASSRKGVSY